MTGSQHLVHNVFRIVSIQFCTEVVAQHDGGTGGVVSQTIELSEVEQVDEDLLLTTRQVLPSEGLIGPYEEICSVWSIGGSAHAPMGLKSSLKGRFETLNTPNPEIDVALPGLLLSSDGCLA